MPRVLLLIPTTSYRAADFLAAAEKENVDVVIGSNERQALEAMVPERSLVLDFKNPEEAAGKAIAFAQRYPFDAVVPTDEDAVLPASLISKALGLPHNSVDAISATQDKSLLRTRLMQAGVRTPRASCFWVTDDPKAIASHLSFPVVLKPVHLSASRGVIRANDPTELEKAFQRIVTILKQPDATRQGQEKKILVESFIPGVEVALEGMLHKGVLSRLAIFDKPDPLDGPFFEETLYVTPSRLPDATRKAIQTSAEQACQAIGLKEGPVHAEFRIHSEGVFVLEVAARSIGGICSRALTFGLGVSLEQLILRHAQGKSIVSLMREAAASGVMMIPIPKAGRLAEIHGMEDAQSVAGISGIVITMHRTQKVIPLPEGGRYLGFIFARGQTPEEVEQALRLACTKLSFEIVPERPHSAVGDSGCETNL